jgi:hypothetical protein
MADEQLRCAKPTKATTMVQSDADERNFEQAKKVSLLTLDFETGVTRRVDQQRKRRPGTEQRPYAA